MSDKKLSILQHILEVVLQFVTFLGFTTIVYFAMMNRPENEYYICLVILVPIVLMYILRHKVRIFFLFVFIHLFIPVGLMLLGNNTDERVLFFIIGGIMISYSIRLKSRMIEKTTLTNKADIEGNSLDEDQEERRRILVSSERISIWLVSVMALGYFLGAVQHISMLMEIEAVLTVIFVIGQVLYNDFKQLNNVYILHGNKSEFPHQQIRRVNFVMIIGVVLLVLLGMLLFYNGKYGNIFTILGDAFLSLLGPIVWFILFVMRLLGKMSNTMQVPQEETTSTADELTTLDVEPPQNHPAMNAFAAAVGTLIVCAIIVFAILMIVRFARRFKRARQDGNDFIENVKEEKKKNKFTHTKHIIKKETSNQSKARKVYKNRVKKGFGKSAPDKRLIPEELTKKAITDNEEVAGIITDIYEKARYSDQEISREELENIKKMS
jgi:heme/copper-type cytochrome/quinol oxidase subunit 2